MGRYLRFLLSDAMADRCCNLRLLQQKYIAKDIRECRDNIDRQRLFIDPFFIQWNQRQKLREIFFYLVATRTGGEL